MIVTDGFTGNVFLKVMEGTADALLGRGARGGDCRAARAKAGGLLLRPALRGLRDAIDPEAQGGAFLLGLRRLGVVPHGSFGARGIARAIELAARGVRADVVGGRTSAGAAGALRGGRRRGAARRTASRPPPPLRSPIHDPRASPRPTSARTWPTSCELDPARVEEDTRFKEDLEADSLDLYSLVQELEDTYGVQMSDEQAARIKTVGQAVDFVLASDATATASRGPDPCARCTTCSRGCRTTSPGRRSRTPRGPSGARTATSGSRCWATPCSACRSRRTCSRCSTRSPTAPAG